MYRCLCSRFQIFMPLLPCVNCDCRTRPVNLTYSFVFINIWAVLQLDLRGRSKARNQRWTGNHSTSVMNSWKMRCCGWCANKKCWVITHMQKLQKSSKNSERCFWIVEHKIWNLNAKCSWKRDERGTIIWGEVFEGALRANISMWFFFGIVAYRCSHIAHFLCI